MSMPTSFIYDATWDHDILYGTLTITATSEQTRAFMEAVENTTTPTWYLLGITRVLIGVGTAIAVVPHIDGANFAPVQDARPNL